MPLMSKLIKAGGLTLSSINEKTKTSAIKRKIKKIEKKASEGSIDEKTNLEKQLNSITTTEKEKRELAARDLKREIKESRKERSAEAKKHNIFRRIQREFKDIPVISAADDVIEGISGLENAERIVSENPEEPLAWLLLGETLRYHRKTFLKVQKLKLPVDFFGSIIDVGTEYIGDFIETAVDKDKITCEKALDIAYKMVYDKKEPSALDLVVLGRCMQIRSQKVKDIKLKYSFCESGEKYYIEALNAGLKIEDEGEIYFYLSEIYHSVRRFKEHRNMLFEAKNRGFVPAQRELCKYTTSGNSAIPKGVKPVDGFKYSVRKTASEEVIAGASNLINKQGKKIARAGERILDTVLDKIVK